MREELRRNGDPEVARKTLPVVMDDAAGPIEEALQRHDVDLTFFLWNTADRFGDRWPWAWIFFPECYPLASHVRSVRREQPEMPFTLYGREPDPVPRGWMPCVGAVMPMTKEVLSQAASRSPMFESSWKRLAGRAANAHWACLSDPLDERVGRACSRPDPGGRADA